MTTLLAWFRSALSALHFCCMARVSGLGSRFTWWLFWINFDTDRWHSAAMLISRETGTYACRLSCPAGQVFVYPACSCLPKPNQAVSAWFFVCCMRRLLQLCADIRIQCATPLSCRCNRCRIARIMRHARHACSGAVRTPRTATSCSRFVVKATSLFQYVQNLPVLPGWVTTAGIGGCLPFPA